MNIENGGPSFEDMTNPEQRKLIQSHESWLNAQRARVREEEARQELSALDPDIANAIAEATKVNIKLN